MSTIFFKQVILVRTDIKMSVGKLAAQVAHAAVGSAFACQRKNKIWLDEWLRQGQKKVVLKVSSLDEMLKIWNAVKSSSLPCELIRDAGHTELPPGTITTLGIGPAPEYMIDKFTRQLPLL
ncbi:MAG: peptidyl-tRNA hydrolase Pth2 [Candidatus Asgardarchaeia archaeon]